MIPCLPDMVNGGEGVGEHNGQWGRKGVRTMDNGGRGEGEQLWGRGREGNKEGAGVLRNFVTTVRGRYTFTLGMHSNNFTVPCHI